ncbi:MAG: TonB-dependent receptor [Acidobacteria bacterium]|nr:MAG: TonB-dependent receptor [Acidobacteriota bacterium]
MRRHVLLPLTGYLFAVLLAAAGQPSLAAAQSNTGTIKGHIHLSGKLPGNPIIRMGVDPMCARINAGKRIVQESVVADINGGLANVFVKLQGTFPQTPVPAQPVTIDQRGCIYIPRVVGMRVGQMLQIKNSDAFLHNVHSLSAVSSNFNVGQPTAGLVYSFRPKEEEIMLRLKCDIHSWMTAYVGVVSHPYFTVSSEGGVFQIDKVPVGTYTIQAWHERYGVLTQKVRVSAGATVTADFTYGGAESRGGRAGIRDLTVPAEHLSTVAIR